MAPQANPTYCLVFRFQEQIFLACAALNCLEIWAGYLENIPTLLDVGVVKVIGWLCEQPLSVIVAPDGSCCRPMSVDQFYDDFLTNSVRQLIQPILSSNSLLNALDDCTAIESRGHSVSGAAQTATSQADATGSHAILVSPVQRALLRRSASHASQQENVDQQAHLESPQNQAEIGVWIRIMAYRLLSKLLSYSTAKVSCLAPSRRLIVCH